MPYESYGDNQLIPFDQLIASQLEATRRREEELAAQMAAEQRARQVPSPNQNDQQRRIIAGQLEREFGITCSEILSSGLPKDTVADEKLRSSSGGLSGQGHTSYKRHTGWLLSEINFPSSNSSESYADPPGAGYASRTLIIPKGFLRKTMGVYRYDEADHTLVRRDFMQLANSPHSFRVAMAKLVAKAQAYRRR